MNVFENYLATEIVWQLTSVLCEIKETICADAERRSRLNYRYVRLVVMNGASW